MAKKQQQYRWRPAPWRVGEDAPSAGGEPAAAPEGKKKAGTIALVVLGAGAVAFGMLELLGVTKVFAAAPAVPPPVPAPAPGTTTVASGTPAVVPAPAVAPR